MLKKEKERRMPSVSSDAQVNREVMLNYLRFHDGSLFDGALANGFQVFLYGASTSVNQKKMAHEKNRPNLDDAVDGFRVLLFGLQQLAKDLIATSQGVEHLLSCVIRVARR